MRLKYKMYLPGQSSPISFLSHNVHLYLINFIKKTKNENRLALPLSNETFFSSLYDLIRGIEPTVYIPCASYCRYYQMLTVRTSQPQHSLLPSTQSLSVPWSPFPHIYKISLILPFNNFTSHLKTTYFIFITVIN